MSLHSRKKKKKKKKKKYFVSVFAYEREKKVLTRWWWGCQYEGSGGSGGGAGTHVVGGGGSGGGEWARCLGHMGINDWSMDGCPHTCRGLKWCMGVMGGKPMVGASQGLISLFPPPPPPPLLVPYICRLWLQLAASASRASKCFRCDLYFWTNFKTKDLRKKNFQH